MVISCKLLTAVNVAGINRIITAAITLIEALSQDVET